MSGFNLCERFAEFGRDFVRNVGKNVLQQRRVEKAKRFFDFSNSFYPSWISIQKFRGHISAMDVFWCVIN
jgi:hypothetical protein